MSRRHLFAEWPSVQAQREGHVHLKAGPAQLPALPAVLDDFFRGRYRLLLARRPRLRSYPALTLASRRCLPNYYFTPFAVEGTLVRCGNSTDLQLSCAEDDIVERALVRVWHRHDARRARAVKRFARIAVAHVEEQSRLIGLTPAPRLAEPIRLDASGSF